MGGAEVGEGHSQGGDMAYSATVIRGLLGISRQTAAGSTRPHAIPGLGFILRLWVTIKGFRTRT